MSRIRNCITYTAGAAAGLFLAGLASSATATADTATPTNPDLPGLFEQVITAPSSIPQQLLQTTSSALGGAPATPPTPSPVATDTVNLPGGPATAMPGAGAPAGTPAVPGLPGTGNLSSLLPFPLPNFGGTPTTFTAPPATLPGAFPVPAPAAVPVPPAAGSWSPVAGLP
jgi:hypothetical protein